MYKVIRGFCDLQDIKETKGGSIPHPYSVGDTYPRKGLTVSDERLAELASSNNLQGVPLIEEVKRKKAVKKSSAK